MTETGGGLEVLTCANHPQPPHRTSLTQLTDIQSTERNRLNLTDVQVKANVH